MKKSIIFIVCAIFIVSSSFSQSAIKPIDFRYDSKEDGFRKFLSENLSYPKESLQRNSEGFSISSITITPNGKIDSIAIINSIDTEIDAQILKVLRKTKKHWKATKETAEKVTFYVQVGFARTNIGSEAQIESPVTNKYFIQPLLVQSFNLDYSYQPLTNDTLAIMCYDAIKTKNYQDASNYINKLIQRNPFNKAFYDLRILINRELKNTEEIKSDLQKINNFIPGHSLHSLLRNNS